MCDEALRACELSVQGCKELNQAQEELIKELAKQRNDAYKQLGEKESQTPWYIWLLGGAALGIVLGQTVVFK
jgi:hypothetical protein